MCNAAAVKLLLRFLEISINLYRVREKKESASGTLHPNIIRTFVRKKQIEIENGWLRLHNGTEAVEHTKRTPQKLVKTELEDNFCYFAEIGN